MSFELDAFRENISRTDIYNILKYCMSKVDKEQLKLKTRWKDSSPRTMYSYFYRGYSEKGASAIPMSISKQFLSFRELNYWLVLKEKAKNIIESNDSNKIELEEISNPQNEEEKDSIKLVMPQIVDYPDYIILNNRKYIYDPQLV